MMMAFMGDGVYPIDKSDELRKLLEIAKLNGITVDDALYHKLLDKVYDKEGTA